VLRIFSAPLLLIDERKTVNKTVELPMSEKIDYTPPKVWTWTKPNGGTFANINRLTAGPTHEKELPVGRHPLQLYSMGTPNGVKITVMLEELLALGHTGAEYDAWLVDIYKGDQFGTGFVAINPNSKIPAMVDRSGPEPITVFESGSILLYLAEKFGAFLPKDITKLTTFRRGPRTSCWQARRRL